MRKGGAAVLALSALLCLALLAPAAAQAAGSISGTVTDASTAEPIEGLEVCAYPLSEEWEAWFCTETDAAGEYTVEDLEPDEYAVEFWGRPQNYIPQYYDGKEIWWESDPVLVDTDPVTGIDAEMVVGGRVEGTVSAAASGEPIEEVFACAWRISDEEFGGCGETDGEGEYAIGGMPAGAFEIEFWPGEQDFLGQYYDHKAHWWEADPVVVTLADVDTGIDADLLAAATVEGQVRHGGSPVFEAEVCAWSTDPEGAIRCALSGPDGRYAIHGAPPDEYKVEFWDYASELGQFWDHKASWEQADPLSLAAGSTATGIDADIGDNAAPVIPPAIVTPPATTPPVVAKPRPKRCKKGFRKKRVHGKVRCVKKKRRHRHRHPHLSSRPAAPDRATFRLGR